MPTTMKSLPSREQLTCESGGWVTCCVAQPEMEMRAMNLLAESPERRPGNLRLAIDGDEAYFVGELRDPDGLLGLPAARQRMLAAANDAAGEVPLVEVACVLGETGYEWSQPQDKPDPWQAVASGGDGHRCELTASIVRGGVEVRSRLADWETGLAETSRMAIDRFLAMAHGRVRFARFMLQEREASAISFAAADRLDVELPDSVAAVVAASRLVWREVRALANDAVARIYLEAMV